MFKGSMVALVTPLKKNGKVDQERLRFLVDWHIKNKTDGILVCGTTGESATLSHQEHKEVANIAVDQARGRIPIIAGAGSNSTEEALDLARHMKKIKADAILVITPYYNKPTQEGLYQHYKKINDEVKIPLLIYNVPSRTGINIQPETVKRVYDDCANVIGIKEASGSLKQISRLMSLVDKKFTLLSGNDEIVIPLMSIGGKGVVSVVANILPKQTHNMVDSFLKGNTKKAADMQLKLLELINTLFIETNPIPVKTAMKLMGLIQANMRLPLVKMNKSNLNQLKTVLKKYSII